MYLLNKNKIIGAIAIIEELTVNSIRYKLEVQVERGSGV